MDEKVKKKLKEGWIQASFFIEVLAVNKDAAKTSLEDHVKNLSKEKKTIIYKTDFKEIKEVKNPLPTLEKGYSNIVEVELLTENFDTLIFLAMNYGPTSIEILQPEKITLDTGEAQGILNSIADVIHKFARQGLGGIIIRS